ncbi:hypothetical protein PV08_06960 [Exophiala spinifera]|uniref:Asl1-like glycosyl hydrolase catalytic domain-containing protein n=1 Tax=Exophiala spinifera TaxID=91928 RepID=A0A0D2BSF7_9EURO|nr:uncharacterized protein PV08_06960 [Exophiala spinifera]KIW14179.1 hypothetical protein PV08_06960 [Exophiala spinifera]
MLLLAFFTFFLVAFGTPLTGVDHNGVIARDQPDDSKFKGIDFSKAYNDCNASQLAILQRASFVAVTEMLDPSDVGLVGHDNDFIFGWFFGQPKRWKTKYNSDVFDQIKKNLKYPYNFVWKGKQPDGNVDVTERLSYTCSESTKSSSPLCQPGTNAYVANPSQSKDGKWTVTFCPDYWTQLEYADKLWDKSIAPRVSPSQLNIRRTFEDELICQYMQVDIMGFHNYSSADDPHPHIGQEWATLYGTYQSIQGAMLANNFAYLNPGTVNNKTASNLDSYALFFLAKWVNKKYGGVWNNAQSNYWDAPDPDGVGGSPP